MNTPETDRKEKVRETAINFSSTRLQEINLSHIKDMPTSYVQAALIDGYEYGYEACNQEWKEKLKWMPVEKILPDEGELVLVSPCENPKNSDIDLCWYKDSKFKLYVAMKDDDVNGSGVKRPDMTSSTRFWKGVNKT